MNRRDLQDLSRLRFREAKVLLDRNLPDGSYHLSGLAVEAALKACIARDTKRFDFPDKVRVSKSHVHDLSQLLDVAVLRHQLGMDDRIVVPGLATYWAIVKDWQVESRYRISIDLKTASDFYRAARGVARWLRRYW